MEFTDLKVENLKARVVSLTVAFVHLLFSINAIGDPLPAQPSWRIDALVEAMDDPCLATRSAAVRWIEGKSTPDFRIATKFDIFLLDPKWNQERREILYALNSTGSNQVVCVTEVLGLLPDPDPMIRLGCIDALRKMPLKEDQARKLLHGLKDAEPNIRISAIGSLTNTFADLFPGEIATLAITDTNNNVRLAAVNALVYFQTNAIACATITNFFKSDDASIRIRALEAFSNLQTNNSRYALCIVDLLHDKDGGVRFSALQCLGSMGALPQNVCDNLVTIFHNSGESTEMAISAMSAYCHGPDGTNCVRQNSIYLTSTNAILRQNLLYWLQKSGIAALEAAPAVKELLRDSNPSVRLQAVKTLRAFDGYGLSCASDIAGVLNDPDGQVRDQAWAALRTIRNRNKDFEEKLIRIASDANLPNHQWATDLISAGPQTREQAKLTAALLNNDDPAIRSKAAHILLEMGECAEEQAPQIAKLLRDPIKTVKTDAISIILRMPHVGMRYLPEITGFLNDPDLEVRLSAIRALGDSRCLTTAPKLATFLSDPAQSVRTVAVYALCNMGETGAQFSSQITPLLLDDRVNQMEPGDTVARNLQNLGMRLDDTTLFATFELVHAGRKGDEGRSRLIGYTICGVTTNNTILRKWLGFRSDDERPQKVTFDEIRNDIVVLHSALPKLKNYPDTCKEAAEVLAFFVRNGKWDIKDIGNLTILSNDLNNSGFFSQASEIDKVIRKIYWRSNISKACLLPVLQLSSWIILLLLYPRSRLIQAFFFWNKWVRRFVGLGYVGLLIPYIPWVRRRLFEPFRESLVPKGLLEGVDSASYFSRQEVVEKLKERRRGTPRSLITFSSETKGQIVIEGESGLGKTLFLQKRASSSKRIAVLLRATDCSESVLAAVQRKLQGQVKDEIYLKTLLHAGAVELLIDGLNETSPDTRSKISSFVEDHFRGTFILTTQPLSGWSPPNTARIYELSPLKIDQIEEFLLQQWNTVKDSAKITSEIYPPAVKEFLRNLESVERSNPNSVHPLEVLRNPMEACLAADLLAEGKMPDVFQLVEQRYDSMVTDFQRKNRKDFPLIPFAEMVYKWRSSSDGSDVDMTKFGLEALELTAHRLMIQRVDLVPTANGPKEQTRWFFRHDRIMEFFLLPAFMGTNKERRKTDAKDPRFWGVYDLLAMHLNEKEELELYKFLNELAANTNENELRNRYEISRRRRKSSAAPNEK